MASKLKPIGHDERLSLVEHLDELRTRLIICTVAFVVAFGVCLWQDDVVLDIINRPLTQTAFSSCDTTKDPFEQANCWQQAMRRVNRDLVRARRRGGPPGHAPSRAWRRWPSGWSGRRTSPARRRRAPRPSAR